MSRLGLYRTVAGRIVKDDCIRGLCRIRTALLVWGIRTTGVENHIPTIFGSSDGFDETPIKQPPDWWCEA